VFIDHGDGVRLDSVGGMTPGDISIALGKECVAALQFLRRSSCPLQVHGHVRAVCVPSQRARRIRCTDIGDTGWRPSECFFRAHFPHRNYSIPNTQFLDSDGQAAKAWYAAAFMNETITRLGTASGTFALLLENEAYFQNDVSPFSFTQSTPQWQTASGS
jgi:hypothetical protein